MKPQRLLISRNESCLDKGFRETFVGKDNLMWKYMLIKNFLQRSESIPYWLFPRRKQIHNSNQYRNQTPHKYKERLHICNIHYTEWHYIIKSIINNCNKSIKQANKTLKKTVHPPCLFRIKWNDPLFLFICKRKMKYIHRNFKCNWSYKYSSTHTLNDQSNRPILKNINRFLDCIPGWNKS